MFDTLFSPLWFFDLCLIGASLYQWVVLAVGLACGLFAYFQFKPRIKEIYLRIALTIVGFVASTILISVILSFSGFFLFKCSDSGFWSAITPAHALHALMKQYKETQGTYPQTEEQLQNLSPNLFRTIGKNAKQVYIYNASDGSYVWMVRPSHYYVVIFDSKKDYALYQIPYLNIFPRGHWYTIPNFPPKYSGPWDQLPK
jgi:hypothetical protein